MFWQKTIPQQMQPVLVQVDYDMVFRDGTVQTNADTTKFISAAYASQVVSMLGFLDSISQFEKTYSGADAKEMDYLAQHLLMLLKDVRVGQLIEHHDKQQLSDMMGLSNAELNNLFDSSGRVPEAFVLICTDVLKTQNPHTLDEIVYADSQFYDEQFEMRAHNISLELVQGEHGVYTLVEPAFDFFKPHGMVYTRDGNGIEVNIAQKMLGVLRNVERDRQFAWQVFSVLHETYSGDDVPIAIIGLFDEVFPEGHSFFINDTMDVFTKNFFETVLRVGEDGQVKLDTSNFDRQIENLKRAQTTQSFTLD